MQLLRIKQSIIITKLPFKGLRITNPKNGRSYTTQRIGGLWVTDEGFYSSLRSVIADNLFELI